MTQGLRSSTTYHITARSTIVVIPGQVDTVSITDRLSSRTCTGSTIARRSDGPLVQGGLLLFLVTKFPLYRRCITLPQVPLLFTSLGTTVHYIRSIRRWCCFPVYRRRRWRCPWLSLTNVRLGLCPLLPCDRRKQASERSPYGHGYSKRIRRPKSFIFSEVLLLQIDPTKLEPELDNWATFVLFVVSRVYFIFFLYEGVAGFFVIWERGLQEPGRMGS